MNKTPSALKWLAEKRARLANDVALTTKMAQGLTARQLALEKKLAALDETIGFYDAAIDVARIAPVAHWAGRYGKRGALRDALLELLTRHAPEWVAESRYWPKTLAMVSAETLDATPSGGTSPAPCGHRWNAPSRIGSLVRSQRGRRAWACSILALRLDIGGTLVSPEAPGATSPARLPLLAAPISDGGATPRFKLSRQQPAPHELQTTKEAAEHADTL